MAKAKFDPTQLFRQGLLDVAKDIDLAADELTKVPGAADQVLRLRDVAGAAREVAAHEDGTQ